jgi:uncharacterized membrane protein YfcA
MRKPESVGTIFLSAVGAALGDGLYRWWRHGTVDWVGAAEVGLGCAITAACIAWLARLRQRRQQEDGIAGSV